MSILSFIDLSYSYNQKKTVFKGLNAELELGKIYAILGSSGCGKTTLLSLLGGLDSPTKGKIFFNGEDITEKGLAYHRRNHVSFIFQSYNLLPSLNAIENVALPLSFRGVDKAKRQKMAKDALEMVGLNKYLDHLPTEMSGGQQQRVGIARALVLSPEIIFADEPTGNLDSHTTEDVLKLMQEQKKYI